MLENSKSLKIIILDDEADWCTTISETARMLGHVADAVSTLEEAHEKIQGAYNAGTPYHVAIVDLIFETGKNKVKVPRGKEAVRFIKTRHPYMACVVVSGADITSDHVLDMRDEYGLDYYLQKDRFDLDTFSRAIEKSVRRIQPIDIKQNRRKNLMETLEKSKDVRAIFLNDLSKVKEREALKGIDVDVATHNEIERFQAQINEIEKSIALLEKEISESAGDL